MAAAASAAAAAAKRSLTLRPSLQSGLTLSALRCLSSVAGQTLPAEAEDRALIRSLISECDGEMHSRLASFGPKGMREIARVMELHDVMSGRGVAEPERDRTKLLEKRGADGDEGALKHTKESQKKLKHHQTLLKGFAEAETLDEAHKLMLKVEKFEEQHLELPLEYKVIGDLMNALKESTGKERFILLQKLNRATIIMERKETYDPTNPENFGVIKQRVANSPEDSIDDAGFNKQKLMIQGMDEEDDDLDDMKDKDEALMEKIDDVEKKIEEKLTQLDFTFGKKGKHLEEEIRDLVEERNSLTERKRRPLFRKGFVVKVIDVNRTVRVTKAGQIAKYSALLATGNHNGVVGFARAKGPTAKVAIQRAYEKCFQNLHYVERYQDHTIAHAIQANYEKTKIYLWPAPKGTGVVASWRTVGTVLLLAGFSNVKSKIIGSRNSLNVIKALFIALNAIESPKDVQEKFGRTVVESSLL